MRIWIEFNYCWECPHYSKIQGSYPIYCCLVDKIMDSEKIPIEIRPCPVEVKNVHR